MFQIQNVTKQYVLSKKQQIELQTNGTSIFAVNNVSFTCIPGRVFSLLGPNGAGKTTLLRMISTILKPSSGNILVIHLIFLGYLVYKSRLFSEIAIQNSNSQLRLKVYFKNYKAI